MSRPKELNFFIGADTPPALPTDWSSGNWHRGPAWYAAQFDASVPVRGEASPGYTSPSHPQVAMRMARLIPSARLVYAVRDPVRRAVSQYWHHRREGSEIRPLEEALLDPRSQYVARGRYFERLEPSLAAGFGGGLPRLAQLRISAHKRLIAFRQIGASVHLPTPKPRAARRRRTAPIRSRPIEFMGICFS